MRKFLAAVVAVLFFSATFAQSLKGKTVFGFKVGINASTFRTAVDYPDFDPSYKAGLALGCFVEIPLSSRFKIQPEFLYSQMGSKGASTEWGNVTFKYNYFAVPLLVKFNVINNFSVFAGPEADVLIRARQHSFNEVKTLTNNIQDFDCGFTVGAELALGKKWTLHGRYIHGIRDCAADDANFSFFNQGFQLNVGYKIFKKAKKAK
jgi:hypothetical protein